MRDCSLPNDVWVQKYGDIPAWDVITALVTHLIEEEVIGEDDKEWTQKTGMALHNKAAKVRNILRAEQRLRLIEAVKGKV